MDLIQSNLPYFTGPICELKKNTHTKVGCENKYGNNNYNSLVYFSFLETNYFIIYVSHRSAGQPVMLKASVFYFVS